MKNYTANVPNATPSITMIPTAADATATVTVNGTVVASETASQSIPLGVGPNVIHVVVTAQDGVSLTSYTLTVNFAPAFGGYAFGTRFQTSATVSLAKLLAKASDPSGDALSVTAAGLASAQGGTAVLQVSGIVYTPPAGFSGTDTFSVTITDALGAATSGTVTATVGLPATAGGQTGNPPIVTVLGGQIGLTFQGIPGRSYQIQRSTDLSTWATITSVTANSSGTMIYTDASPPQPSAYYRIAIP